tara:strand:+ start:148 stop:288 length:141 start_codon:yes stop_codon:yes gene_type:complete
MRLLFEVALVIALIPFITASAAMLTVGLALTIPVALTWALAYELFG